MATIAENMLVLMHKNHMNRVWMGDIHIIEECAKLSNIHRDHPRKVIQAVLNGLEKSKLFEKGYLSAECNGKKRKFRCFSISKKTMTAESAD